MSQNLDTLTNSLSIFGLSPEEIRTYLAIVEGRGDTALTLSRTLKLARTKVYRLLDSLIAQKLVITRLGDRGSRFLAAPPQDLDFLLDDRQRELDQLKRTLPALQESLTALASRVSDTASVLYYHSLDGIKQVTYNSLRAKSELLTYEVGNLDSFLDHTESERLRERFVENKIHIRTLTNTTECKAWTDVTELVEHYWQMRHLPPQGNPFQFEILIYNGVFCLYRYSGAKAFAVEIHSQELADMQRQLFEYLWSGSKKFKILDSHGAAKLV